MDKKTKAMAPMQPMQAKQPMTGVFEPLRQRWEMGVWHLGHLSRRFPGPPPVAVIGWVPHKRQWVQHGFGSANFSFLLAGTGSYQAGDSSIRPIVGPTVIRQYPGLTFDYGPQTTWCELFLIYGSETLPDWQQRGATQADSWSLTPTPRLYRLLDELLDLSRSSLPYQEVDRIDRLAEWLVVESLRHNDEPMDWRLQAVARLRAEVERDPSGDWDVLAAAVDAGLSASHFRRLWQRSVGMPPLRYRRTLRLQEACQQLLHQDAPIASIAQACGFSDQLYFARCFRAFTGMSASGYRRRFRDGVA